jgi:hypothetical protein
LQLDHQFNKNHQEHQDKVAVVNLPNVVVDPFAMVVEAGRAAIADSTMLARMKNPCFTNVTVEVVIL